MAEIPYLSEMKVFVPLVGMISLGELRHTQKELISKTQAKAGEWGITLPERLLSVAAWLDTPEKVQGYIDNTLKYNEAYLKRKSLPEDDTAMGPTRVVETGFAHCFEASVFAHLVNTLHGHTNGIVVLEAVNDLDHNICVWKNPKTGLWGANSIGLTGRPATFQTVHEIARSYVEEYTVKKSFRESLLVGYSDPLNFFDKYGYSWIEKQELWDEYWTYLNDADIFHNIDDPTQTHLYPFVNLMKRGYIGVRPDGYGTINYLNMPTWEGVLYFLYMTLRKFSETKKVDFSRELNIFEKAFYERTGTTPQDMRLHALKSVPEFHERGNSVYALTREPATIIDSSHVDIEQIMQRLTPEERQDLLQLVDAVK